MAAIEYDASPYEWVPKTPRLDPSWTCRCGKKAFRSWAHARADARAMRRRRDKRIVPYWSKHCHAIHTGEKTKKPRT